MKRFVVLKNICFVLMLVCCFTLSGCSLISGVDDSLDDINYGNKDSDVTYYEVEIGTTFTLEGIDITINDYVFKYFALKGSYEAGDNKVWVIANVKLYNNSTKTINLNNITDKLIYKTDTNEEATYNSKFFMNNNWVNAHESIEAFETIEAMFMYQIPVGIAPQISGYDYSVGGKYSSKTTKNINYEIRFSKNSISAKECYVVKL